MIYESPQALALPRGLVTVDLINERGKVVQREQAENFISIYTQAVLKQLQRNTLGMYFAGTRSTDAWGRQLWDTPPLPFNHIATWNDTSSESATTEHTMKGGFPTAFASRFPQGSPSGKRGVINITDSVATDTYQRYVFDWLTSNGNGTFRSVGWTTCDTNGKNMSIWPNPYFGAPPLSTNITTPTTWYGVGLSHDGVGWLTLHSTGQAVGTSQWAVYRVDEVTGDGTLLFALPSASFRVQSSNNGQPPNAYDLCMIGTDYYVVGNTPYPSGYPTNVAKYNSAGVQQWLVAHDGGANEMPNSNTGGGWAITTDGTDLYVGFGSWSAGGGKVYKLSATTGLVTATITPPHSVNAVSLLAWDGANLRVVHADGIAYTMDLNGNQVLSDPSAVFYGQDSGTATSPFSGPWLGSSTSVNQETLLMYSRNSTGTTAMDDMLRSTNYGITIGQLGGIGTNFPYGGGLHSKNGKLFTKQLTNWLSGPYSTTPAKIIEVNYSSLGSRVLLPAPVTKDSSKSMKITYQFDFS